MSILAPAISISNKLKFKFKFLLLAVIFYVPLLLMCLWVITSSLKTITGYDNELLGVTYLKSVSNLEVNLSKLQRQENEIKSTQQLINRATGFDTSKKQLNELSSWHDSEEGGSTYRFYTYTSAIREDIASSSGLARESDGASFYLTQIGSEKLPSLLEFLIRIESSSINVIENGFTAESYTLIVALDKRIDEIQKHLAKHFSLLDKQIADKVKISTLSNRYIALSEDIDKFQSTLRERVIDPDEITLSTNAAKQQLNKILLRSRELLIDSQKALGERIIDLKTKSESLLFIIALSLLLVTLISSYFLLAMYRSLSNNVLLITQATERLGNGDFSGQLNITSTDELGAIGDSFSQMQHKILSLLSLLTSQSQLVMSAATDIQLLTSDMEGSISEQQQNTHSVASAINQMGSSISIVHQNTEQAKEITIQASENVGQGQQVIQDTERAIDAIALEVNSSATVINKLAKNSDEITQFVSVIREIADQTNLLALNAAIEAARAGEQGRGFAVVADEVRTLAGRTQEATNEIQQIIEKLQQGAGKSVEVMNSGVEKATAGVEQAQHVASTFSSVTLNVNDIVSATNEISLAVAQQNQMIDSVFINTKNIAQGADDVMTSAKDAAKAGTNLSEVAEALTEQLTQFKLA